MLSRLSSSELFRDDNIGEAVEALDFELAFARSARSPKTIAFFFD